MIFHFNEKKSTPLCEIMERYGSDKGGVQIETCWHNYTTFYYSLFKERKLDTLRVFELGLGTNNLDVPSHMGIDGKPGASHYGWGEFFPNSTIFGADIDTRILFTTDKIKTFYCDQTNQASIQKLWSEPALQENFDIIIEDGLHKFHANVCFFENSIHKLNKNGYFIIEDISFRDYPLFVEKIPYWEFRYSDCSFTLLKIPLKTNQGDNTLLVVFKS